MLNNKREQPKTLVDDAALTPIDRGKLVDFFTESACSLARKVECVASGRTSLVLKGVRPFTFFVDLVFLSEDDLTSYIESLKSSGYKLRIFGRWLRLVKKLPVDVSLNRAFLLTSSMLKRTTRLEKDTGRLVVNVLQPQDVMILDCLSWHAGDLDDVKTIIEKTVFDWSLLLEEVKERISMEASRRLPLGVFYALEKLQARGVKIPRSVLEDISEILCRQDLRTHGPAMG